MSESPEAKTRRRWINFGEVVALAALIVSAVGVWIAWQSNSNDKPTRVVEQKQAIPLTLRGTVEHDGRELIIAPVEQSHALESLNLFFSHMYPLELGSDGSLKADDVAAKVSGKDLDKGTHRIKVEIDARYVEMGKVRKTSGTYILRYRVEGGGLFGGRSIRLISMSR
jgi:hypothetical protein